MNVVIAFIVGVFAGGFGGYKYGASVQKKAAAELAAAGAAVAKVASKV